MPGDNRDAAFCARGGHDGGHDGHADSGDHDGEGDVHRIISLTSTETNHVRGSSQRKGCIPLGHLE